MPPQVFRYQATARDADGDALSYRLLDGPAGARIDAASGLLLWESPQAGEQFFRLEADDGKGNRVEQRFTVQFGSAQRTGTSGKPPAPATPCQRNHEFQPGERAKPSQAKSAEHGPVAHRLEWRATRLLCRPTPDAQPLAAGVPRRRGPCAEHGSCSPADPDHALR
jgi:hypothetical protein